MTNLNSDAETLDAHMTAQHIALVMLVRCLEESGSLRVGHYAEVLKSTLESSRRDLSEMTLAMLHGIREAVLK